jgi:hypothetical protein
MIELLDRLEPAAKIDWAPYTMSAQIDWLHSDKRVLENPDQVYPSSGPSTIIPQAIFTIVNYVWESVGW